MFTVSEGKALNDVLETKIYYRNIDISRKYNSIMRKNNKKTIH